MSDQIILEILEDGTIKVTTDPISPANHLSAEQLLGAISRLAGGEVTKAKRGNKHSHSEHHHHHEEGAGN